MVERSRGQGDCSSGRAQHLRQKLVREGHAVRLYTVMAGQYPSGQPFRNGMQAVAGGVLRALKKISEYVFLNAPAQFTRALKLLLQQFGFNAKTRSCNLNESLP